MASVWNFIKRHRGKIVLGGALVGGFYAVRRVLRENPNYFHGLVSTEQSAGHENLPLTDSAKKNYIFDSNQRTCDNSIVQLIPLLMQKLKDQFNVESIAEELRILSADYLEEKLNKWTEMKTMSLARLLAAAYSYSLLICSLKIQISISAAQIYRSTKTGYSMGDYVESFVNWTRGSRSSIQNEYKSDPATQQLFLQALQYFTTTGVSRLADNISAVVKIAVSDLSLTEKLDSNQVRNLLNDLCCRIDTGETRHFSFFVVPLTSDMDAFASGNNQLKHMLMLLKARLETPQCRQLMELFMGFFVEEIIKFCHQNSEIQLNKVWNAEDDVELQTVLAVAKLIPIWSDCFEAISSTEFGSVVQNILTCSQLHELCQDVFENDSARFFATLNL